MSRFTEWWQKNPDKADEIRLNRRLRRQLDPAVRQQERASAQDRYQQSRAGRAPAPVTRRGPNQPKTLLIDGQTIEIWSRGRALAELGITAPTLRRWEDEGVIPVNRTQDGLGRYWWPADFIRMLQPIVDARTRNRISRLEMAAQVQHAWSNSPDIPRIARAQDRHAPVHIHPGRGARADGAAGRGHDDPLGDEQAEEPAD